jgi:hypothetical protein
MGALSQKVVTNNAGALTEVASISTSAGVGDASKLVATTASGIVDPTLINAKNTSAGAGDAAKVPLLNASGILDSTIVNSKTTSAGAGDSGKLAALNASGILDDTIINATVTSSANKIAKLDASGKLDSTVMPTGVGADTASITASEALAAGDLVNVWNNAGTANVRKADGSVSGKEAHGFVLAAFASAASATVYFESTNTQCTGLTPGVQFLSAATAGKPTSTAPTGTGKVNQVVGFAISATAMNFNSELPIVLA